MKMSILVHVEDHETGENVFVRRRDTDEHHIRWKASLYWLSETPVTEAIAIERCFCLWLVIFFYEPSSLSGGLVAGGPPVWLTPWWTVVGGCIPVSHVCKDRCDTKQPRRLLAFVGIR